MATIDPKLLAMAKSARPDLVQRLIVMKATEAGRGILLKPPVGPPMPLKPPLPALPDAGAAKAAMFPRPAQGAAGQALDLVIAAYSGEAPERSAGDIGAPATRAPDAPPPGPPAQQTPPLPSGLALPLAPAVPRRASAAIDDAAGEDTAGGTIRGVRRGNGAASRTIANRAPVFGALALGAALLLALLVVLF